MKDELHLDSCLTFKDVKNEIKEDGTTGAPSLYANIPIVNIRNEMKKDETPVVKEEKSEEEKTKKSKTEKVENEENKKKQKKKKYQKEQTKIFAEF